MTPTRRRRGRAPTIDKTKIAAAVRTVACRGPLSMAAVADELSVDVTTLYRRVPGIDALRQLGATLAAPVPSDWPSADGRSWREWLGDLASHYRRALKDNRDLTEFAHVALDPDFQRWEAATSILVGFGFEPRAAGFAHGFLLNTVVGFVRSEQREAELVANGQSSMARFVTAMQADAERARLPVLHDLQLGAHDFDPEVAFSRFLAYAIDGIAAQPGVPK